MKMFQSKEIKINQKTDWDFRRTTDFLDLVANNANSRDFNFKLRWVFPQSYSCPSHLLANFDAKFDSYNKATYKVNFKLR